MDEDQLNLLTKKVAAIQSEAAKLSIQMNNLSTFANLNGYSIDWEQGTLIKI